MCACAMRFAFGLGAWRLVLALAASFYAVFGALRLGVVIDAVLFAGAVGLLVQYVQEWAKSHPMPSRGTK